jgi:hypothetical protein
MLPRDLHGVSTFSTNFCPQKPALPVICSRTDVATRSRPAESTHPHSSNFGEREGSNYGIFIVCRDNVREAYAAGLGSRLRMGEGQMRGDSRVRSSISVARGRRNDDVGRERSLRHRKARFSGNPALSSVEMGGREAIETIRLALDMTRDARRVETPSAPNPTVPPSAESPKAHMKSTLSTPKATDSKAGGSTPAMAGSQTVACKAKPLRLQAPYHQWTPGRRQDRHHQL